MDVTVNIRKYLDCNKIVIGKYLYIKKKAFNSVHHTTLLKTF